MIQLFRVELLLPRWRERIEAGDVDSIILSVDWEYCECCLLSLMTFVEIKENSTLLSSNNVRLVTLNMRTIAWVSYPFGCSFEWLQITFLIKMQSEGKPDTLFKEDGECIIYPRILLCLVSFTKRVIAF